MHDATDRLLARIPLGEDGFFECKEVFFSGEKMKAPKSQEIADEMAAFANSHGGTLVFGVQDQTWEIVGIAAGRLHDVVRRIMEAARDQVSPSLAPEIECHSLPNTLGEIRNVVRVGVEQSQFVHRSPGGFLRRVGDSRTQIPMEALTRLVQHRSHAGLLQFDEEFVARISFGDLDPALISRFRTDQTSDDSETLAIKLGMARRGESGVVRPTVAGVLLGCQTPTDTMPNAFIQAVAYRGREVVASSDMKNYQLDAKDFAGPLDTQVEGTCRFVAANQRVRASKELGRTDEPQYDMPAIFEAVVNAVAHRDYSMALSHIRLRMFADRIELNSPGALPNTMEIDMLPYRQAGRNPGIASLLAKCSVPDGIPGLRTQRTTLMDRRGEGVQVILRNSEALAGRRPRYEMLGESELRLTIFAAEPDRRDGS